MTYNRGPVSDPETEKPGMRYNHWTVIGAKRGERSQRRQLLVECDCGARYYKLKDYVVHGISKECDDCAADRKSGV